MSLLKNYMENMVFENIDAVLAKTPGICACERCKLDVAAIALNNLQPRYVVTEKGELFTKLQSAAFQYHADVVSAIAIAAASVSKNPRHL